MALRRLLVVGLVLLLLAGTVVGGLALTDRLPGVPGTGSEPTPAASRTPTRPAAAPVLADLPASASPAPALPVAALQRVLRDPALRSAGAVVVDARTGETLLDSDGAAPRTPASVAKLVTGAGALLGAGAQTRLTTRVVAGPQAGDVVLVGAGDPTLTTRPERPRPYPLPATMAELASETAVALRAGGVTSVRLRVDDRLFVGPAVSPAWRSSYVPGGVVSPVSALAVDAGRVRPHVAARARDPALAAGANLAGLLERRGIAVSGRVSRGAAPPAAKEPASAATPGSELAAVSSPTVAELVENALTTSDNDVAEALLRVAAHGLDLPASFRGGQEAIATVLARLDLPTEGASLLDGSGLARGSQVSPATVAGLLGLASRPEGSALRALVTGLPVGGFSGTLDDRFDGGSARAGAGLVRAKTGTLTGVSSLAGTVEGPGPRLYAFAVLTDGVPPGAGQTAENALDRFAATLARGR